MHLIYHLGARNSTETKNLFWHINPYNLGRIGEINKQKNQVVIQNVYARLYNGKHSDVEVQNKWNHESRNVQQQMRLECEDYQLNKVIRLQKNRYLS